MRTEGLRSHTEEPKERYSGLECVYGCVCVRESCRGEGKTIR